MYTVLYTPEMLATLIPINPYTYFGAYMTRHKFLRALSCKTRLKVAYAIRDQQMFVGELAEALDIPQSEASRAISTLRDAGAVVSERAGNKVLCSLSEAGAELLDMLDKFDWHG